MGTKIVTRVAPYNLVTTGITSATEHKRLWDEEALGDFDRDHMATAASVATISSTSLAGPKNGELRVDTSTTPHTLREYDGSTERAVAADYATAAPSTTVAGSMWWDTTLELHRVYNTVDGIAGWHPLSTGYQLWTNRSGADVVAGAVVVTNTPIDTTTREFSTTTFAKDERVIGVAMEAIADDASGVIAMVSSGAIVNVLCDDGEADGAVARGAGLVTYTVDGEARTVGFIGTNTPPAATQNSVFGTPSGCFARALGGKDGTTHLVRAQLLGYVGSGAVYRPNSNTTLVATMTAGSIQAAAITPSSTFHSPLIALEGVRMIYETSGNANVVFTVSVGPSQSPTQESFQIDADASQNADGAICFGTLATVKTSGVPTDAMSYTLIETTVTFDTKTLIYSGYWY